MFFPTRQQPTSPECLGEVLSPGRAPRGGSHQIPPSSTEQTDCLAVRRCGCPQWAVSAADRRFSRRHSKKWPCRNPPHTHRAPWLLPQNVYKMLSPRWRRQARAQITESLTKAPLGNVGNGERYKVKSRLARLNKRKSYSPERSRAEKRVQRPPSPANHCPDENAEVQRKK